MLRTSNFANFNVILFEKCLENFMLLPFHVLPLIIPYIFPFRGMGWTNNDAHRHRRTLKSIGLIGLYVYIEELNSLIGSGFNSLLILLVRFNHAPVFCECQFVENNNYARLLQERKNDIRLEKHAVIIECPLKQ